MLRSFDFYFLDVFTEKTFGGNQLAVFPFAVEVPEIYMQKIAREINFSETTFVLPPENPRNDCKVRIFTPGREVPTAGHPTIGTAHLLLNRGLLDIRGKNSIVFEEKVGDIPISFKKEVQGGYRDIVMNQPLPVFGRVIQDTGLLARLLSLKESDIDTGSPIQQVSCGNNFLFVPVKSLQNLSEIKLRVDLLENYQEELGCTEIYVFTIQTVEPDSTTHGRMFAPLFGIFEDPATGSATGPLGCYLVKYGYSDGERIICEQGFEMGRKSMLYAHIEKEGEIFSLVQVSGNAVIVGSGKFEIEIG